MDIALWILQILLALHTFIGAVWKCSNGEDAVPSLQAIPHALWLGLAAMEVLCAIAMIAPAFVRPLALAAPIAALLIAAEMLLFSGIHLASGTAKHGELIYWLAVAVVCGFLAYGRFALRPIG